VVLALLLAAGPALAQQRAEVIDGDTLRVGGRRVRMAGLDAPELHGRCAEETRLAQAAAARLRDLVADGVVLQLLGSERWHRQLAVVRDLAGRDLAEILIRDGLARRYDGRGRRGGWC